MQPVSPISLQETRDAQNRRRAHHKSRNGCAECKRRRIKCDERRPTCRRCQAGKRQCPFQALAPTLPASHSGLVTPHDTTQGSSPSLPSAVRRGSVPQADLMQARLLNHFAASFDELLPRVISKQDRVFSGQRVIDVGVMCPYLMNQILAFSAQHMAVKYPAERDDMLFHAHMYQTHALSHFTLSAVRPSAENCVQVVLFSWLLGVQLLSGASLDEGQGRVLDSFLHFLDVYRGVRTVVVEAWTYLLQTDLASFIHSGSEAITLPRVGCASEQFVKLEELVSGSVGMPEPWKKAVRDALALLKPVMTPSGDEPIGNDLDDCFKLAFSWPLAVDVYFQEAVRAGRPEALITLAHFAVVIHWCRDHWIFSDAGRRLLRDTMAHVGPGWERWLQWPMNAIEKQHS